MPILTIGNETWLVITNKEALDNPPLTRFHVVGKYFDRVVYPVSRHQEIINSEMWKYIIASDSVQRTECIDDSY